VKTARVAVVVGAAVVAAAVAAGIAALMVVRRVARRDARACPQPNGASHSIAAPATSAMNSAPAKLG
jgi:hypothetical protein